MTAFREYDLKFVRDNRRVRFTNKLDADVLAFESQLLQQTRSDASSESPLPVELTLYQSSSWLKHAPEDFRLLQIRDQDGLPALQLALLIDRPRRLKSFATARVQSLGCSSVSGELETWALQLLPELVRDIDGVMKLRIYPYRARQKDLLDFESRARRAGFRLVDPIGVTRTLTIDLVQELDDLVASWDRKIRAKIRHPGRALFDIRVLSDVSILPQLENALESAFARTRGGAANYDFATAFKVAHEYPDQFQILGVFRKTMPDKLLAYSLSSKHGAVIQHVSAGSIPDPELRKVPFNFFVMWEVIQWSRKTGAKILDLGGVTDGGPTDPLAGISDFKRWLSKTEIEIGREMELELSPLRCLAFAAMVRLKNWLRASPDSPQKFPEILPVEMCRPTPQIHAQVRSALG